MSRKRPEIIFYTKKRCPLCEEGKAALEMVCEDLGVSFLEKDIYKDDALLEHYQLLIPAVTFNGELVASGIIDRGALKEIFIKLNKNFINN